MNALLCRVGADQSIGGGSWNGPVDTQSGNFVYVSIPETRPVHTGMEKPYSALAPVLATFATKLPPHLYTQNMHLDPDFDHLTYGDQGERAKQLRANLSIGDILVFYAGLSDIRNRAQLVYAIIGVFVVEAFTFAAEASPMTRDTNAHSRRILPAGAHDLVIRARPGVSGRLQHCLPIGEWRDRAYRVRYDLLEEWGGLSVRNGYIQRSARLPRFLKPHHFQKWLNSQNPTLLQANN